MCVYVPGVSSRSQVAVGFLQTGSRVVLWEQFSPSLSAASSALKKECSLSHSAVQTFTTYRELKYSSEHTRLCSLCY